MDRCCTPPSHHPTRHGSQRAPLHGGGLACGAHNQSHRVNTCIVPSHIPSTRCCTNVVIPPSTCARPATMPLLVATIPGSTLISGASGSSLPRTMAQYATSCTLCGTPVNPCARSRCNSCEACWASTACTLKRHNTACWPHGRSVHTSPSGSRAALTCSSSVGVCTMCAMVCCCCKAGGQRCRTCTRSSDRKRCVPACEMQRLMCAVVVMWCV